MSDADVSIEATVRSSSVVVCCGSGGVGKTTTAAVIGLHAAEQGRRAVVVTIDPARRLADALGLVDGLEPEPTRVDLGDVSGELWAMMLDPAHTFDGLVRSNATDPEQVERILSNGFYRNIAGALSGTQEYMAAETLHALHHDDRFDLVIVDTPPSRNALDFLDAPGVLTRFLDHKIFKLVMLPTRSGLKVFGAAAQPILKAIGRVVGSDVLSDAMAFFQAFAGMEGGFRDRAADVTALIAADITQFVVVASPRTDTVEEATWFAKQLTSYDAHIGGVVVNRAQPSFRSGTADDARAAANTARAEGHDVAADGWSNVADMRAILEAESAALVPLAEAAGTAPLVRVPLLGRDVHDLDGLRTIADSLFAP